MSPNGFSGAMLVIYQGAAVAASAPPCGGEWNAAPKADLGRSLELSACANSGQQRVPRNFLYSKTYRIPEPTYTRWFGTPSRTLRKGSPKATLLTDDQIRV